MFERIYVEITNICNLSCSFCQGTTKPKRQLRVDEFRLICEKIKHHTKFIYLHVMGEPLLHPHLEKLLSVAKSHDLKVCITTNGTLLDKAKEILLKNSDAIHKISISLHCAEANENIKLLDYLESVINFSRISSEKGIFTVLRLWNEDSLEGTGQNLQNEFIESFLKARFPSEWQKRPRGYRLEKRIFLEYDGLFTWPSSSKADAILKGFCHGLENQLAILCDGTVVPCCLDSNGELELGNIFEHSLNEILSNGRAQAIKNGFKSGKFIEPLCQKCTFARRFKPRNN